MAGGRRFCLVSQMVSLKSMNKGSIFCAMVSGGPNPLTLYYLCLSSTLHPHTVAQHIRREHFLSLRFLPTPVTSSGTLSSSDVLFRKAATPETREDLRELLISPPPHPSKGTVLPSSASSAGRLAMSWPHVLLSAWPLAPCLEILLCAQHRCNFYLFYTLLVISARIWEISSKLPVPTLPLNPEFKTHYNS